MKGSAINCAVVYRNDVLLYLHFIPTLVYWNTLNVIIEQFYMSVDLFLQFYSLRLEQFFVINEALF